jgi:hypothetical protein
MIPYDDLVSALATWRARHGLPVAHAPAVVAPAPVAAPAPRAPAPAAPAARAQPAQPPPGARTSPPGPPGAPPRSHAPLPLPAGPEDDEALIESSPYDDGGEDYVVPLGDDHTGEQTAIDGSVGSLGSLGPGRGGKRSHDW